jgi:Flp pilus assembly protein TadG
MFFRKDESGQIMVMLAFTLAIMIGFGALALDCGILFRTKRNLQIAADAAATAGALNYLYYGDAAKAKSAAAAAAQSNGYGSGSAGVAAGDGSVATVNVPPTSGAVTGSGYIEAVVSTPNPTYFMRVGGVLGLTGLSSVTVAARAVAGLPTYGDACIWLMATSGTGLYMKGSATINAPNCGIYVNSTSSDAFYAQDKGNTVNAEFIDVVGGSNRTVYSGTAPLQLYAGARKNPWGNLSNPSCGTTYSQTEIVAGSGTNTTTKLYAANINTSSGAVCFSGSNVQIDGGVMMPGTSDGVVYEFQNGVKIAGAVQFGTGSCSGSGTSTTCTTTAGATLDVAGGAFSQNNNSLSIYASTTSSNSYNGIALMVPETNTYYNVNNSGNQLNIQWGSSSQTLDGYIYAPYSKLYVNDSGGGITASGLIAWELIFNSGNKGVSLTTSYDAANSGTTPNRIVTLVQ